jgi:hypothetical protein
MAGDQQLTGAQVNPGSMKEGLGEDGAAADMEGTFL